MVGTKDIFDAEYILETLKLENNFWLFLIIFLHMYLQIS